MKKVTVGIRRVDDDPAKPVSYANYELPFHTSGELKERIEKVYGDKALIVSMSEHLAPFDFNDMSDLYVLNEVLLFIETRCKLQNLTADDAYKMWDTFVAIQEVTAFDVLETFRVFALGDNVELFDELDEMGDVAKELVRQDRLFKKPVPTDVRPFLDYDKLGDSLLEGGEFYLTSKGILYLKHGNN